MKIKLCVVASLCGSFYFPLSAQTEVIGTDQKVGSSKDTVILGSLITGEIRKVKPKLAAKKRDFKIKSTYRQRVGNRSVRLHEVEEPPAQEQASSVANQPATDFLQKSGNRREKELAPTKLIMVSATVYGDGEDCYSKITVHDGIGKITCWSKANAFYLAGCDHWKANDHPYYMLTSIVRARNPEDAERAGCPMKRLRRAGNRYVVTESNQEGGNISREVVSDIHKLYHTEKKRLRDAYQARKRNAALRASLPQAEPEPPKPVTIHFWKRDLSKEKKERGAK